MPHPIVHVEFQVKDAVKAKDWYANALGWETSYMEEMKYGSFMPEKDDQSKIGGGFNGAGDLSGTVVYLGTDDVTAALNKIKAAGGEILAEKTPIPGFGYFGLFKDPDGNVVGFYQDDSSAS